MSKNLLLKKSTEVDKLELIERINATISSLNEVDNMIDSQIKFEENLNYKNNYDHLKIILNCTATFLETCITNLNGTALYPRYPDKYWWNFLLGAIHRYFLSNICSFVEQFLEDMCKHRCPQVSSSTQKKFLNLIEKLKLENPLLCESKTLEAIENEVNKPFPSFSDRLNKIMKHAKFAKDEKIKWKNFFDMLRVMRNLASHADRKLTSNEKLSFKNAIDATLIPSSFVEISDDELKICEKIYPEIIKLVLLFLNSIILHVKQIDSLNENLMEIGGPA